MKLSTDEIINQIWEEVGPGRLKTKFRKVLLYFSVSNNYEEAIKEWDVIFIGTNNHSDTCICSHYIEDNRYVINIINGNELIIGSDCINKFFPDDVADKCTTIKNMVKYSGDKFQCGGCGKHLITDPTKGIFCGGCKKEGVTYPSEKMIELIGFKHCNECKKDIFKTIKGDECPECEIKKSFNKCLSCREYKIKKEVGSDWKNKCGSCYYKDKPMTCGSDNCGKKITGYMKYCCFGCKPK